MGYFKLSSTCCKEKLKSNLSIASVVENAVYDLAIPRRCYISIICSIFIKENLKSQQLKLSMRRMKDLGLVYTLWHIYTI